ncbi:MAG: rhomboid family intramembrane serine protease [Thermomicrobiales bacterium]
MIPISDDNRGRRSTPYVSYILIILNILVFLYQFLLNGDAEYTFILDWGAVPAQVSKGDRLFTLVSCIFLHGSWLHLGGNMLFLWVFGDNVEDVMGHVGFILFYLLTGIAASASQIWLNTDSLIPLVGASGAISGVLAAYIVLFPRGRVVSLIFLGIFVTTVLLPAWVMIGYWIALQLLQGFLSLGIRTAQTGGVAYFAHIGGFLAGLALVWLFADRDRTSSQRAARQGYETNRRNR